VMRRKLGLDTVDESDEKLVEDLLQKMEENQADFTLTFRRLANAVGENDGGEPPARDRFIDPTAFDAWSAVWLARLLKEGNAPAAVRASMLATNPLYIPRNHLVEESIAAAYEDDFGPFEALTAVLSQPFTEQAGRERYAQAPLPEQRVRQTFCGT